MSVDLEPTPALSGFRVGVASDHRAGDLIDALVRRGAAVTHAPALPDSGGAGDLSLLADTRRIIADPPDHLVLTTASGIHRWREAADASGLGGRLREVLGQAAAVARDPAARCAARSLGLDRVDLSDDNTTASLVAGLLQQDLRNATVAVQLHGYTDGQLAPLTAAGATLVPVSPFRRAGYDGPDLLPLLIESACSDRLDVLIFTSPTAVDALLNTARELGHYDRLLAALRGPVATAVVGPLTAQPLLRVGVDPLVPEHYRMGALVRLVSEYLGRHRVIQYESSLGPIELRGSALRINGTPVELAPAPLVVLKALLEARGAVLTRAHLASVLPGVADGHALDMTVSRLRKALPDGRLVSTVVKRGYRVII